MHYFLFIAALVISFPAYAQFEFGGTSIGKPQSMMVAGDSVIDAEPGSASPASTEPYTGGDAVEPGKAGMVVPPIQDIDPFSAPTGPSQPNVKRVVKKIPTAKSVRSINDERIDDGYVQQLMKKQFDYSGPIE